MPESRSTVELQSLRSEQPQPEGQELPRRTELRETRARRAAAYVFELLATGGMRLVLDADQYYGRKQRHPLDNDLAPSDRAKPSLLRRIANRF
jgi:hypothetical protein